MVTQHNDIVLALTPLPGLKDFADGAINPAQGAQRRARRGATPMTEYVVADEAAIDHRHTAQHVQPRAGGDDLARKDVQQQADEGKRIETEAAMALQQAPHRILDLLHDLPSSIEEKAEHLAGVEQQDNERAQQCLTGAIPMGAGTRDSQHVPTRPAGDDAGVATAP